MQRLDVVERESLAHARCRALLARSTEAIALTSVAGITVYMSPAADRVFGRPAADFVGKRDSCWIYADDCARLGELKLRLLADPSQSVSVDVRTRLPDDSLRWIEVTATNLLADPEVGALLACFRDITARHDSAQALQNSELRYRQLVEISPEPIFVHVAHRLVYANSAGARLVGVPGPMDLIGRSIVDFATPATRARIEARMALMDEHREPLAFDQQSLIRESDGREVHIDVRSLPFVYDGQPAMLSITRDITRSVEAERTSERSMAALEFERNRLRTVLEKSPAFYLVVRGIDHVVELANDAFCKLAGKHDSVGRPARDALPELREHAFLDHLDRVFATGELSVARGMSMQLERGPGRAPERRIVNVTYQPLVEADGSRTGVFVHGMDVTDEKLAEQRTRAQFDAVPVPTHVWQRVTRDGVAQFVLVDFNEAAVAITRGEIARRLGVTALDFFAATPDVIADLDDCLDGDKTIQREMNRMLGTTGEVRRLFVTYAAAPPDLVIVHSEDITERRKLETQLLQAQKMDAVGRLAGGVAHDFNNILTVILSYAAMALDDPLLDERLRSDLTEIHRAGLRAVALTRQLLAFSRQQVLQPRVLDLNQLLAGLATMLRRLLGEDVALSLLATDRPCGVFADPGQLEQVIVNLAVNARDAMPTGGRLTIETAHVELDDAFAADHAHVKPGRYLMLAVTDTGVGMDDATRAQIFEPFFTTKAPDKGTGLGLAMVFGVVHQTGGTIGVDSEPDHGTTFKIYLPCVALDPDAAAIPSASEAPLGGTETILLVEDDDGVRAIAQKILRRGGYNVLEAQNAGEAFLACEQFAATIHLLLTDVVMPRMSGRVLAERLQPLRREMKVLYMSGFTDDAVLRNGILEAGVAFIQKPLTSDALLREVRNVLDDVETARSHVIRPR